MHVVVDVHVRRVLFGGAAHGGHGSWAVVGVWGREGDHGRGRVDDVGTLAADEDREVAVGLELGGDFDFFVVIFVVLAGETVGGHDVDVGVFAWGGSAVCFFGGFV